MVFADVLSKSHHRADGARKTMLEEERDAIEQLHEVRASPRGKDMALAKRPGESGELNSKATGNIG